MAVLPQLGNQGLPENKIPPLVPPGFMPYNSPTDVLLRRGTILDTDGSTRLAAQYEHDTGTYKRMPVGPVEYGEGNIKKSTQPIGVAGYNQRAFALPDSADDMSQEEYGLSFLQSKPESRERLRMAMLLPAQRFLYRPSGGADYGSLSHNMMNNLLSLAKQKVQG